MPVNPTKMGEQIRALRNGKGITQNELAERLNVTFQTVSKWERGETLPDTAILPDLANVLETTVDNILMGGERLVGYTRRVTVAEVEEGIACFERIGELLGVDHLADSYQNAVERDGLGRAVGCDGPRATAGDGAGNLALDGQAGDLAIFSRNRQRGVELEELATLCDGTVDLLALRRHILDPAAIDDSYGCRAEPNAAARDVHRDVAATDDGDALSGEVGIPSIADLA